MPMSYLCNVLTYESLNILGVALKWKGEWNALLILWKPVL